MSKITKEDIKKVQSLSDMKHMVERMNQRSDELKKLMAATAYPELERELCYIENCERSIQRQIREFDMLHKTHEGYDSE